MKKFFVAAIALIASAVSVNAADLEWRVQAGLDLSKIKQEMPNNNYESDMKPGFNVGVRADYPINNGMYVQAGALVELKGGKFPGSSYSSYGVKTEDVKANALYLTIPIHFGYRYDFNENIGVFGDLGPYFGIGLAGKYKQGDNKYDYFTSDGDRRRFDLGAGLRVGPEFKKKYSVALGADWGIFNTEKDGNDDFKVRNFTFSVSLGYKF